MRLSLSPLTPDELPAHATRTAVVVDIGRYSQSGEPSVTLGDGFDERRTLCADGRSVARILDVAALYEGRSILEHEAAAHPELRVGRVGSVSRVLGVCEQPDLLIFRQGGRPARVGYRCCFTHCVLRCACTLWRVVPRARDAKYHVPRFFSIPIDIYYCREEYRLDHEGRGIDASQQDCMRFPSASRTNSCIPSPSIQA